MKKIIVLLLIVLTISVPTVSKHKLTVSITGNVLLPDDSGYKDVYGGSVFLPEIKLDYKIYEDFYFWLGYGFLSAAGTTPTLGMETSSRQHFFSFGGGYNGKISNRLGYTAELGAFVASYREEAMDVEMKDSAVGFRVDLGLIYHFTDTLFTGVWLGYLSASDTVADISINLGGIKGGIGLGFRL